MENRIVYVEKLNITKSEAEMTVRFAFDPGAYYPRISAYFCCESDSRIVPMDIVSKSDGEITASGVFDMPYLFYSNSPAGDIKVKFLLSRGNGESEIAEADREIIIPKMKGNAFVHFIKSSRHEKIKAVAAKVFSFMFLPYSRLKIKDNRVAFISNRDDRLTGNIKAVFYEMTKVKDIDIVVLCKKGGIKKNLVNLFKFFKIYATSSVVFVDDYYHLLSYVKKKDGVTLVQLWHACGAFKTFGFSRLGRDSALRQSSPNHRQYDYVIVSSDEVIPYYAEGFGVSVDKIVSLGSPRCDVLENEEYAARFRKGFYKKHSDLKNKKIILFAPTFRGGGQGNCYYPMEKFDIDKILGAVGDEYCIAVKVHPYLSEKPSYSKKFDGRVLDFTDEYDINDLLLVSDLLITDYSSVIFEASIVGVPMLFFAFDLNEYSRDRDFYCDYAKFVPGRIVMDTDEIINAVKNQDYKEEAVAEFKKRYFTNSGNATDNVINFTKELLKK